MLEGTNWQIVESVFSFSLKFSSWSYIFKGSLNFFHIIFHKDITLQWWLIGVWQKLQSWKLKAVADQIWPNTFISTLTRVLGVPCHWSMFIWTSPLLTRTTQHALLFSVVLSPKSDTQTKKSVYLPSHITQILILMRQASCNLTSGIKSLSQCWTGKNCSSFNDH